MDNKIITENKDNAEILNPVFSNAVKKFKITSLIVLIP